MATLKISELWIYPVKSLGGIAVQQAKVLPKGFEHDRRWMLMDEQNIFLTQRVHSKMALFKMSFDKEGIQVTHQGNSEFIPFGIAEGVDVRARIWDDEVTVKEVTSKLSQWFSHQLGIQCKLVAFPEHNDRAIDPRYKIGDDHVSLADAYPVLIAGQASLDDLNERMKEPLPMNRFRPNIVFTGGDPFEEDAWNYFDIGEVKFAGVKPSKRCILTTVDQDTAKRGAEPLVTLATYRKRENGVYFGQNVIPINTGTVNLGEEIKLKQPS